MITSKRFHFIIGLFVSLLYGIIYTPRTGLCLAVSLSLLKEYKDQKDYQQFHWKNTVTTWAGGFIGFIITALLS